MRRTLPEVRQPRFAAAFPGCATALGAAIAFAMSLGGCGGSGGTSAPPAVTPPATPALAAEVALGRRLFFETRFAQAFKAHLDRGGGINDRLATASADPVLAVTVTTDPARSLPGPFAGLTMNCQACHLVDEHAGNPQGGMRTYSDFARRSPVPARGDGVGAAPRNSPTLAGISLERANGTVFHFDGEFSTLEDVVAGTLASRNFGWLPGQKSEAFATVARVIREDDGTGEFARRTASLSYRVLLEGTSPAIPAELRLASEWRLAAATASDAQVVDAVSRLLAAYVNQIRFSQRTAGGTAVRSPYDVFLSLNGLPARPDAGETAIAYSRRLLGLVLERERSASLRFVTANPNRPTGTFEFHAHPFAFGPAELEGLKIFFAGSESVPTPATIAQGGSAACVICHPAPAFTGFGFFNTGVTQREYDGVHGPGAFARLAVPSLAERSASPGDFLPATHDHPAYREPFRAAALAGDPRRTDLGLWNILLNPDFPAPQAKLRAFLCQNRTPCPFTDEQLLAQSLARFKSPTLRNTGHTGPYMHNGAFDTLEDAIAFYIEAAQSLRAGTLRNGDPQLQFVAMVPRDVAPLAAFVRALDEDYQADLRPDPAAP